MAFFVQLCYNPPMNRRNYQKEMERIIERQERKPRLLLHSCCGPCSSSVLEKLAEHFDISLLWYNPNLYPEDEFRLRLATQKELLEKMGLDGKIHIIETPWRHEEYLSRVTGLEQEKEGGARCAVCFRLRLDECARLAAEQGFDYFCTTLSVSRHKDAVLINAIGETAAKEHGARWLPSDFKKKDGENRSVELSEHFGIYRQVYCGCEFSLERRLQGKDPV